MASSSSFYGGNPTPTEYRDIDDLVAQAEEAANTALNAGTNAEADAAAADAARIAAEAARDASSASAVASSNSAGNSATSATNAAASALAASNSASNASTSASNAQASANNASTSAGSAAASATNAANSASSATASAAAAYVSEQNADASEAAAASSATAAASSASAASTSATNAATSATAAASSQSAAATSASNAATSASNAASSASAAAGSATTASSASSAAASAQAAAEAARDQTLASFDSFDDRYLGAKTSDPTLDNDGNALVAGSLYFNSVDGAMKVYTGTVWVDAYAAGLSFLAKVNNLSDLPNAATARTNLGLGTAATQNSTAFANASHTHPISDVTNLQTTLDLKVNQTSTTGAALLPASTTANRPASPLAGYIRYNTTTGKFEGYGSSWGNIGGGAAIGDTPPANPGAGDLWWNSADGRMYVYYTDANSSQWVDLSAGGAGQYLPLTGGTVSGNFEYTGTLTGGTGVINIGSGQFYKDASGNVGIGTTSPIGRFHVAGDNDTLMSFANTSATIRLRPYITAVAYSQIAAVNTAGSAYLPLAVGGSVTILETNGTERARFLSGGQFVINGTQERGRQTIYWDSNTQQGLTLMTTSSTYNGSPIIFLNGAAGVSGFIGQSGGAVSYNTSSDYRLKEAVHPLSSGLSTICALNPVRYKWKTDGTDGEGFIAHELQNVVPLAVVGEKDAINLDGSIKPQGVDYSKIVVHLVSAIQELNAKVNALQSEITVLKGGE